MAKRKATSVDPAKSLNPPTLPDTEQYQEDLERQAEAAIEDCRIAEEQTKNPVYAWQAIQFKFWARQAKKNRGETDLDFVIPAWCTEYLGGVAELLCCLAIGVDYRDLEKLDKQPTSVLQAGIAIDTVCEVLGFKRGKYNAFTDFRGDIVDRDVFAKLHAYQSNGLKYEAAQIKLANEIGREVSVIRKRATRGRRLTVRLKPTAKKHP